MAVEAASPETVGPGRPEPVLLTEPVDGVPPVVDTPAALEAAAEALAAGTGPVAVDTERASGYRYSQRAYLVQLRREGSGTVLVDPIALRGALDPLVPALTETEWVLHAASQDLPCLAELDLRPARLFDTELAGRLAGFDRVSLGALVERLLGYRLEKGHSAADWSRRPLPEDWLVYAALDVELLVALRDEMHAELQQQGKLEWAFEEFEAVRTAEPAPPRAEPWRRTSGIHKVRSPRQLAAVRALWQARDDFARERDIAPGRVLPDSSIVLAAQTNPKSEGDLVAMPVFGGRQQRRRASMWLQALRAARRLGNDELPAASTPHDGPPPTNRWADRDPAAAARLSAARAALNQIAEEHSLPVENLLLPDLVRRSCWTPPEDLGVPAVAELLRSKGAREWQIDLTAEAFAKALATTPDEES
ncbi:ribonuclease D [Saccharopolyspora rhizosphaerae]|uniref:Ribonuclease D n=1 Tax=Saccharopolyspora rhizosphaerae TaxID=2492662 RepID=A0A3R8QZU5_9PSEU|nr:ribonuclease D [Saccharopolyspora rhizosphaerae]RRO14803.1 ribonuclease D [Saccharopolyspora rhizosphaerae]